MIVAFTGPREFVDFDQSTWAKGVIANAVESIDVTRGVSMLAEGAELLFAEALSARGIPYELVIPFEGYESRFKSREARMRYGQLLERAAVRVQLQFERPDEAAMNEAIRRVISRADALVAVCDGDAGREEPPFADVFAFARSLARPIIQVQPTNRRIRSEWAFA